MKLAAQIKLIVSEKKKTQLLETMTQVNAACDWLAERAFEVRISKPFELHRLFYRDIRNLFGLSAQHTCRAIAKVCDTYKRDRNTLCRFRECGGITFDQRTYSFKEGLNKVSLLTLKGRVIVPCLVGEHQKTLLKGKRGQADLIYRKGEFFLFVSVEVTEEMAGEPNAWLGVDLGIRNLAFDSDGEVHSGESVLCARNRIAKLRSKLQSVGTKSAKRHLVRLRRKERNFHSHTNHMISKQIVRKAKDTGRGIAIEDLSGIRDRVTVRKAQRSTLHSWSFYQLRKFLSYKSALKGVLLVTVDPRNTSRTCPECGCVDKANRRSQAEFVCIGCGFAAHADHVGARNIASRARVNGPIVAAVRAGNENHSSPCPC